MSSKVLNQIHSAGLTINPQRCSFARHQIEYLGYVIGEGVIRPQVGKVEAVQSFTVPTTKRKVRMFLGLVGWYRKFVPNISTRAAAFSDLTKNVAPVKLRWSEECDRAFRDLKEALCGDVVLKCPDISQSLTLHTDALGVGLGAVLLQGEGMEQRPRAETGSCPPVRPGTPLWRRSASQ